MEKMVATLRRRGITDERIIEAFCHIDRARFVKQNSYKDSPQSIGHGQTISQPYIVAYMLKELHLIGNEHVLEVGSGSGYVVALLSQLCKRVVGTEIIHELHERSLHTLGELESEGLIPGNYTLIHTDQLGAPEHAPYDRIVVSAAAKEIPQALIDQLANGGMMIIPVGDDDQTLIRIEKRADSIMKETLAPVRFVPLIEDSQVLNAR